MLERNFSGEVLWPSTFPSSDRCCDSQDLDQGEVSGNVSWLAPEDKNLVLLGGKLQICLFLGDWGCDQMIDMQIWLRIFFHVKME